MREASILSTPAHQNGPSVETFPVAEKTRGTLATPIPNNDISSNEGFDILPNWVKSLGSVLFNRAIEIPSGTVTEGEFLDAAKTYLGDNYIEVSSGRYISEDGLRQVRYGKHEISSSTHHGHFEAYDKPYNEGGRVIENAVVEIK